MISHLQTDSEQDMRMLLASENLERLYKLLAPYIKGGFEDNGDGKYSDYDMFMYVNLMNQDSHIYYIRELVQYMGVIFSGQTITQGSLPEITVSAYVDGQQYIDEENNCHYVWSNVELGELVIDENTTVGQFAQAVVENNDDFEYNDQITFLFGYCSYNNVLRHYETGSSASKVTLDQDSSELLSAVDVLDGIPFMKGFVSYNGKLSLKMNFDFDVNPFDYGFTWIHSRKEDGKLKVSTQRFGIAVEEPQWRALHDRFKIALEEHGYDLGISYLEPNILPAAPVLTISASSYEGYDDFIFTCEDDAEMYLTAVEGEEGVEPDLDSPEIYRMVVAFGSNITTLPQSGQGNIKSTTVTWTIVAVRGNLMSPSIKLTIIYDAEGIRTVKLNGEII